MSNYVRMRTVFIGDGLKTITDEAYRKLQNQMFAQIWRERKHRCAVTDTPLSHTGLTYMFHHILEKRAFEQYALCKWNIVILNHEVHNRYETKPDTEPLLVEARQTLIHRLESGGYEYDNTHIWEKWDNRIGLAQTLMANRIREQQLGGI